jgi:hypothetical protein
MNGYIDVEDKETVEDDLDIEFVEIEIEYRKRPKTTDLLVNNTKWTRKIDNGLIVYYITYIHTHKPLHLYMICNCMTNIPINNHIYYYNSKNTPEIFAYISYHRECSTITEISEDIYNGKLKLRKNFAFNIGERQAMDIFYGATKINYNKLLFTDESIYSVSKIEGSKKLYEVIQNYFTDTSNMIITDATANIGSECVYMASKFSYVNAIEITKNTYDILQHNIDVLHIKNIGTILGDCFDVLHNIEQQIIVVDAPWGGRNYKDNETMHLFLSNKEIYKLYLTHYTKAKLFVFKVPCNYNIDFFRNKIKEVNVSIDIYDYNKLDRKTGIVRCYYKFLAIYSDK